MDSESLSEDSEVEVEPMRKGDERAIAVSFFSMHHKMVLMLLQPGDGPFHCQCHIAAS